MTVAETVEENEKNEHFTTDIIRGIDRHRLFADGLGAASAGKKGKAAEAESRDQTGRKKTAAQ
ncbi:MAG TPA: hypothetical protein VIL74_23870 [Pyrinomonadaceae bacterium]